MPTNQRPGDVLAGRYRLVDLLSESRGGRFWRAWDSVLARHVAMHLIPVDDDRAEELMAAARRSAGLLDPHLLRVLDIDTNNGTCYVVNEWGEGDSLDHLLQQGPLTPKRAAWIVAEVGSLLATAHETGLAHGRMAPENVLIDQAGAVKVIGFAVDAALHGLPSGREATDVVDLAGVLYAALTGKWPGISPSNLPPAPQEHGRPFRPRQVRAGVPRFLDTLCDEVLGPVRNGNGHGYTSARAIVDALHEYVVDPAALANEEAERHRALANPLMPQSRMPLPDAAPADVPEPGSEDADSAEHTEVIDAVPEADATQAGVPVFYDEINEVGWMQPGQEPVLPPPPFEEPPERPLFAPDPPEGRPSRAAAAVPDGTDAGYWPWDGEEGQATPAFFEKPPAEPVPGRNWLRIAGILLVCLLVLLATVYAVNRGRGGDGLLGGSEPDDADRSPAAAPRKVALAGVEDFDPFGEPPEENGDRAALAADGDKATAWETSRYNQDLGPGGLKDGVGLLLDLGDSVQIRDVTLTFVGAPTEVQLLATDEATAPTGLEGLEEIARGTATDTSLNLTPTKEQISRYVVVWLTSLPDIGDGFRGQVAEVVVRR